MSVWQALFWGAFSSASLYLGEALAGPMAHRPRLMGQLMGFGAGTLLSAVAYELIPETNLEHGLGIAIAFLLGALTYFVGDWLIDRSGGADRQTIGDAAPAGSGASMFLGALLDGLPEAFILGIGLALGGSISVAFVTAVFVSNIPQGMAGTTSLKEVGYTDRRIFWMWTALTVAAAIAAALGFLLARQTHIQGLNAEAFAAGAVLTMLASAMMPEAFAHGGRPVGLLTVLGFLIAGVLTVLQVGRA
jgi:ZIP family zinc transporter